MQLPIPKIFLAYLLTFIVFLMIDLVWLGFVTKDLYRRQLGNLLSDQVNWTAAIIFYLLYIGGIFIFCIYPAITKQSLLQAIVLGSLFGFFCYATYDLTNLATLKGWPIPIVYIDIVWGTFLTGTVSAAGYAIVKWLQ